MSHQLTVQDMVVRSVELPKRWQKSAKDDKRQAVDVLASFVSKRHVKVRQKNEVKMTKQKSDETQ